MDDSRSRKSTLWPNSQLATLIICTTALTYSLNGYYFSSICAILPNLTYYTNVSLGTQVTSPVTNLTIGFLVGAEVAVFPLGGVLGLWTLWVISYKVGVKLTFMVIQSAIVLVGSICTVLVHFSQTFEILIAGRFLAGFGVYATYLLLPEYLTEFSTNSPEIIKFQKIVLIICYTVWTAVGFLLAIPYALISELPWPYVLALTGIIAAAVLMFSPLFPETPRIMYTKTKITESARLIRRYFTISNDTEIDNLFHRYEYLKASQSLTIPPNMGRTIRTHLPQLVLQCTRHLSGGFFYLVYSFSTLRWNPSLFVTPIFSSIMAIAVLIGGGMAVALHLKDISNPKSYYIISLVVMILLNMLIMAVCLSSGDFSATSQSTIHWMALALMALFLMVWFSTMELVPQVSTYHLVTTDGNKAFYLFLINESIALFMLSVQLLVAPILWQLISAWFLLILVVFPLVVSTAYLHFKWNPNRSILTSSAQRVSIVRRTTPSAAHYSRSDSHEPEESDEQARIIGYNVSSYGSVDSSA